MERVSLVDDQNRKAGRHAGGARRIDEVKLCVVPYGDDGLEKSS